MITDYSSAVKYLYDVLPMFQRVGAAAYKKDIQNTIKLCEALNDPHKKFRSVHVAGTNGKGSTSHMLASILQEAGYKTGLYTSPHLKEFTERIRLNGQDVSQTFVVDFVNRIQSQIEEIQPSFFEITVAMAFDYFVEQQTDIAVIEVGLGGRLDSTNVITPEVSVITNIGWDHKDLLGDTLQKIAAEKAGIIKENIPVVISERQVEVESVFKDVAKQNVSPIYFAADKYQVTQTPSNEFSIHRDQNLWLKDLRLPLAGFYQQKNIPGVLRALDVLKEKGFSISEDHIRAGLQNVIANTHLKGRWQKLYDQPLVVCDTGHNIDGIREVVRQINSVKFEKLHIVFGVVKDKEIDEILSVLPRQAAYYFCQAKLPRALEARILAEKAERAGLHGQVIEDVNEAKKAALKNASLNDFIFIGGSTFVVAELDEL